jgi:type II secretory pathway pseudopilin PulG
MNTGKHFVTACRIRRKAGFALVVSLVMVALLAVIAVGVLTSVSVERGTATSYNSRYQADLAVQNGLQAAAKTLAASPNGTTPVTGQDTFLVVRADGPADPNGNKPAYYYLAKPTAAPGNSITYYPLFSASTDPSDPSVIQSGTINLAAAGAPAVSTPAPPANSSPTDPTAAWNAAGTQRLPSLYSWQQPNAPSGPSVKWVEMRDPQDTAPAPAHNLAYTRYSYWVEDLDGYLDASQVGGQARTNGTSPGEIAMFTVFNSAAQTDPGNTGATKLINNRPLLLTVPTMQQIAATNPDVAGPNLAVRLGRDNNPGEQNLVPLGYGYGTEGQSKYPINPVSQFGPNGNHVGQFAATVSNAMPNFVNRDVSAIPGGHGHYHTHNYLNNVTADLLNYASPLDAPTEFMPPGNINAPPASRGIGSYPFVVSLYDLNNWVATVPVGTTYEVAIETTTYVQLWNPHNFPADGLSGSLIIHYNNSDTVSVNGTTQTLSSPPDATIIFTATPSNGGTPAIVSPLFETGNLNQPFNYLIKLATGYQDPKGKIKPNEYRVVALPAPTPSCLISGRNNYSATGLPPGLSLHGGGRFAGLISGTPTCDPNATYTGGYQEYSVPISARTSCGNASATLVIRIYGSPCPSPTPTATP